MKLNYKNTVLVGFAFLSICAFWQMYDTVMSLMLTNTFDLSEEVAGIFMAADNVLALFMLPLFGSLSDKCKTPLGKRTPFLLFGTGLAALLMVGIPLVDNSFAADPQPWKFVTFIVLLALLLIAMGTYRSPAVALMPDITPKPLRSKANAVINLMGAIGGLIYLVLSALLYSNAGESGEHVNYLPLFLIVGGIMVVAALVVLFTIRENKLAKEMQAFEEAHSSPEEEERNTSAKLPPQVKRSLGFLLASIALWFLGYNGVVSWFTKFAEQSWSMTLGQASTCLTVATAGAILSYIPVGIVSSKVGRKKTILFGTILLAAGFFLGFVYTLFFNTFSPLLLILFALIGLAWAAINVNSLPMVVEMCKGSDVGKFTGYYYTFSMAAQVVTPVLAGFLLNNVGYNTLFPYAALFVALSCVTMCFVKHGDSKPDAAKNIMEQFAEEES